MNAFSVDRSYDDSHKIISYVPTFNTSSKLEFNILVRAHSPLLLKILILTLTLTDYLYLARQTILTAERDNFVFHGGSSSRDDPG